MKRLKVILAAAIVAAATSSAFAIPTLVISDGVTSTSLTDTDADGIITYANAAFSPAWGLIITTGETKPALGSALFPQFDLNVQAQSLSFSPVRNLTISFSDNGFGPTTGTFRADLTGHVVSGTGSNVTYSTFYNAANVTLATTTPLTTTGSLAAPNYNPPAQFSGPFNQGLYSLTQVITINGTAGAGGNYTLDATLVVPEPSSLCLLLSGGAIFGIWRRRK